MGRGFRGHGVRQVGEQSRAEGEITEGPQDVLDVPREPYPGSGSPGHCLRETECGTGQGGPGGPQWGPPVKRECQASERSGGGTGAEV